METTLTKNNANERVAPRALSRKTLREACPFAIGFGSLISWMQLYDTCLLTSNVALFNYSLYGSMAQLAVLAVLAVAGTRASRIPPAGVLGAFGVVGAGGIALNAASPTALCGVAGSVAVGAAMAVLSIAWGLHLAKRPLRSILLSVAGSLLVATMLSFA